MPFDYPIFLDVSGCTVVIIGGGSVAARKARGLAGAKHVRVVAPEFDPSLPEYVQRVPESYETRHLDGAELIFAATSSAAVNSRVVQDARQRGVLVCRTDEAQDNAYAADFISPAVHRDGPVTIAVSAGSAALSAKIRDDVAANLDPRWTKMADAMRTLRPRIRDQAQLTPARRRAMFHELATDEALAIVVDGPEAVWKWLVARHPDLPQT